MNIHFQSAQPRFGIGRDPRYPSDEPSQAGPMDSAQVGDTTAMTRVDQFAAAALTGLVTRGKFQEGEGDNSRLAQLAYRIGTAMEEARPQFVANA